MKLLKIFISLIIFIMLTYNTYACSAFFLNNDKVKVFARNHDYRTHKGFVEVRRKGISRTTRIFDEYKGSNIEPVKWTSKYDNITFHSEEKDKTFMPIGGMNSEGLVIAELYVNDDNTINISFNKTKESIMCSRWILYVLDNYKNVNEVIADITNLKLINNFHAHWFIADKSGNAAIIEYINGNLVIHYGQPLTIPGLTNHPYVYSCNELKKYNFLGLGGQKKELPKGHKSIERFIRGTYRLFSYDNTSPVDYMLKLMKNVARPISTDSPTQWITIYDITNMKIYYRIRHDKKLHFFDFNKEIQKPDQTKIAILKA